MPPPPEPQGPSVGSSSHGTERFGTFELLRPIGSGGSGDVWLARQRVGDSDRLVALKTLRARSLASPEARERLAREARALIRVDHPGICPIFDVGEIDGTPYIAMRHIQGRTLAEWIAEGRRLHGRVDLAASTTASGTATRSTERSGGSASAADRILSVIESLARALHAAHEVGLVHRDVKPGNVMITESGTPVLLDFGLARLSDEVADLTLTGAPVGTPAYMSPEQITGSRDELDRRSDVWSLAVTAYECFALRTPFEAATREGVYRRILGEPHAPLRRLDSRVPRNLDAVIETALQKSPVRRYRTALEFAEDLAAVRANLPTRARRIGLVLRIGLWMRRNRAVTALLLLLATALALALSFARTASNRADEADRSRRLAESSFLAARSSIERVVEITREGLAEVPRFAAGRADMLGAAIAFYRRFADLRRSDPTLGTEVARALLAAARLHTALGRFDAADATFAEAEGILTQAEADGHAEPGNPIAIQIAIHRSALASRRGKLDLALRFDEFAVGAARAWGARAPDDPRAMVAFLEAICRRGENLDLLGDTPGAYATLCEGLSLIGGTESTTQKDLSDVAADLLTRCAEVEARLNRIPEAETHYAAALERLAARIADAAPDEAALLATMRALDERAVLRLRMNHVDEALADQRLSLATAERLATLRPDRFDYATDLASCLSNLGATLGLLQQSDEAAASLGKAAAVLAGLLAINPDDRPTRSNAAMNAYHLGEIELARGELAAARDHFRRGIELAQGGATSSTPDVASLRVCLFCERRTADSFLAEGRLTDVAAAHARATTVFEQALALAPNDVRFRTDGANFLGERALAKALASDLAGAASDSAREGEMWLELIDDTPRAGVALAMATEAFARESVFGCAADPRRNRADSIAARLRALGAIEFEDAASLRANDRYRCDIEALRLEAEQDFEASIERLRTLTVTSDIHRPRALAALAALRALRSESIPAARRATLLSELLADLRALTEAGEAGRNLLATDRALLEEGARGLPGLTAGEAQALTTALSLLRTAVEGSLR